MIHYPEGVRFGEAGIRCLSVSPLNLFLLES